MLIIDAELLLTVVGKNLSFMVVSLLWTKKNCKRLRFLGLALVTLALIKSCALQRPSASSSNVQPVSADSTGVVAAYPDFASVPDAATTSLPDFAPPEETFGDRAQQFIRHLATQDPYYDRESDPTGYVKSGVYTAMALYASGDTDAGNRLADDLFTNPHSASMFLAMAGMDLYLRYGDVMPQELQDKARRFITSFDDYTGGSTENHGIMFATAGYLAAQEWPDWERADAVRDETRAHLLEFIDEMTQHGITEHDSPIYHVFFVNSLLSLHDHATDAEMQQKSTIGLELLLTSMAPEWLKGYWPTSTLRTATFTHDPRRRLSITGPVGWLYWGGTVMPLPEDGAAVMSAVSDYRIPEVLQYIGQDRRRPYVHRETQGRSFNRDDKYRKYTYMDRDFAMYSQYDGNGELAWHDQLQRMGVVWVSDFPGSTFVVKHPVDDRGRGDTKDGQVLQHERSLIGVYQDTLDGYLPNTDAVVEQIEEDGWIFVHGGTVLIGAKIINGYSWQDPIDIIGTEFKRFHSDASRNGLVIQTAAVDDFAGDSPRSVLENFAEAIKTQTEIDDSGINNRRPRLRFVDLSGNTLEMEFSGDRLINGDIVDYLSWPLFENPWMRSEAGQWLEMRYDEQTRRYDFEDWSISSGE